ncbi:MAG: hypothetical protein HY000_13190 [Planctomycetes bacterium]|nr:hypothetical protein [Planctomycetota bacterium]
MRQSARFQGVNWLKWFITHRQDLLQLAEILEAWRELPEPADTLEGLERRVTLALQAARIGVSFTPGELDDQLVEYADRLLQSEVLLELLLNLLERARSQIAPETLAEHLEACHTPEFEALGIPWADLLRLIPYLLEIIRELSGVTTPRSAIG